MDASSTPQEPSRPPRPEDPSSGDPSGFEGHLAMELIKAAGRLWRSGLQISDGGNLSLRLPGPSRMLIKATGSAFASLGLADLVVCDLEGRRLSGAGKPSRDSRLHGEIYKFFPKIGAIVHTHSPFAAAWAGGRGDLPASTYHAALKLGPLVRAVDTGGYAVAPESFPIIVNLCHQGATAILLARHGQMAMGADLAEAVNRAELVEETAKIAHIDAALAAIPK
jgi:L-ribulose-5-phosphate 4-epimerase